MNLLEVFFSNAACSNANSRFTRRGATAASVIAQTVFLLVGIIGMTRTKAVGDIGIILTALILVFDQQAYTGAGGFAFKHAR